MSTLTPKITDHHDSHYRHILAGMPANWQSLIFGGKHSPIEIVNKIMKLGHYVAKFQIYCLQLDFHGKHSFYSVAEMACYWQSVLIIYHDIQDNYCCTVSLTSDIAMNECLHITNRNLHLGQRSSNSNQYAYCACSGGVSFLQTKRPGQTSHTVCACEHISFQ